MIWHIKYVEKELKYHIKHKTFFLFGDEQHSDTDGNAFLNSYCIICFDLSCTTLEGIQGYMENLPIKNNFENNLSKKKNLEVR